MTETAFVIAVSGISGAGKTSVVRRTAELLGDAARLHFDDYRAVSSFPPDLKEWLDRGADVDEWKTPRLADDLRRLRSGETVHLPDDRGVVEPAAFIVLEEPFGRLRREMAELIDLAAHLDVPAAALLARRLLRRLDEARDFTDSRRIEWLRSDLREHLDFGRELDAVGSAAGREAADLVLDGMKTVDEIAAEVVTEARRRFEQATGGFGPRRGRDRSGRREGTL